MLTLTPNQQTPESIAWHYRWTTIIQYHTKSLISAVTAMTFHIIVTFEHSAVHSWVLITVRHSPESRAVSLEFRQTALTIQIQTLDKNALVSRIFYFSPKWQKLEHVYLKHRRHKTNTEFFRSLPYSLAPSLPQSTLYPSLLTSVHQ